MSLNTETDAFSLLQSHRNCNTWHLHRSCHDSWIHFHELIHLTVFMVSALRMSFMEISWPINFLSSENSLFCGPWNVDVLTKWVMKTVGIIFREELWCWMRPCNLKSLYLWPMKIISWLFQDLFMAFSQTCGSKWLEACF